MKQLDTEHGGRAPHVLNLCMPAIRLLSAVPHRGPYTIVAVQLRTDIAELIVTTPVLLMDTSEFESRSWRQLAILNEVYCRYAIHPLGYNIV
jgi:hypothetical protein